MRNWISRQALLADYTLSALARRRGRNLALFTVYAGIVFVLASTMLFTHALRREAHALLAHSPEVLVQNLKAGRHAYLTQGDLDRLGRLRGVSRIEGRRWGYFFDPVFGATYTLMAPASESPGRGDLHVGDGVARVRGLSTGDTLALRSAAGELHVFTVKKVFSSESSLVAADLVLMHPADWEAFFQLPGGVFTDAALSVVNPLEVRSVARKIGERLPETRVILREEILRTYEALFDWREGLLLALASLAVAAFAILAWNQASGLSADERREIGILKAIGWDTRDVLTMKLWEGGLISGAAFSLGTLGAFVHVFHFEAALIVPVLKGWSVLYPRFVLTPSVDAVSLLTLGLLTVFPFTLATLVPAWRAAITDPDEVMRGTT
ncbi:MAG: FtsX-like permease family protein [Holophagales bacterium]|nr:FtsX-like permease family protein [Holophagales bacterium]MBK9964942.1 FtsX-like permease family protein [Holophagales bacterium]